MSQTHPFTCNTKHKSEITKYCGIRVILSSMFLGTGPNVASIAWNTPFTMDVLYSAPMDSVVVIYLQYAIPNPLQRVAMGVLNVPPSGQTAVTVNMQWNAKPVPSNSFALVGYVIDANIYNTDPNNAYLQRASEQTSNSFPIATAQIQKTNHGMSIKMDNTLIMMMMGVILVLWYC